MSGRTDDLSSPIRIEVIMDGKPLELPEHVNGSLTAIRSYLESLALQHGRVVSFFTVDGVIINIIEESIEIKGMQRVKADTISFDELTRQLISTSCDRLKQLHLARRLVAMGRGEESEGFNILEGRLGIKFFDVDVDFPEEQMELDGIIVATFDKVPDQTVYHSEPFSRRNLIRSPVSFRLYKKLEA